MSRLIGRIRFQVIRRRQRNRPGHSAVGENAPSHNCGYSAATGVAAGLAPRRSITRPAMDEKLSMLER